jgi:hypothetical protein
MTFHLASASPSAPASTGTAISGSSNAAGSSKPNDNGNPNNPDPQGHAITVAFSIDKQLSPGSSATVSALVGNPNNQAVLITDVTGVVDAVDKAGCSSTWLTVTPFHSAPGRSIGINGHDTFLLPAQLAPGAPNACKGAHFHVVLTAQGRQA